MSFEFRPEDYPFHIRMTCKGYAHEVIDFALLVVGAAPQADHRWKTGIFPAINPSFNYQAMIMYHRNKVIYNLKILEIINRSNSGHIVEIKTCGFLEISHYI